MRAHYLIYIAATLPLFAACSENKPTTATSNAPVAAAKQTTVKPAAAATETKLAQDTQTPPEQRTANARPTESSPVPVANEPPLAASSSQLAQTRPEQTESIKKICFAGVCLGDSFSEVAKLPLGSHDDALSRSRRSALPRVFVECEAKHNQSASKVRALCDRIVESTFDKWFAEEMSRQKSVCASKLQSSVRVGSEWAQFHMAPFTAPDKSVHYRVMAFHGTSERESNDMRNYLSALIASHPTLCEMPSTCGSDYVFSYALPGNFKLTPPNAEDASTLRKVEVRISAAVRDKHLMKHHELLNVPADFKSGCIE
jgi:hypothetical protein